MENGSVSPWRWIPTLYIAEGLPYFAVNTLTVLMYVNMNISLKEMAFFTGWLYLPWVIKPFWSPFIDLFKTKRIWTIAMEGIICLSMAAIGFFLPFSFFFSATLVFFWIMAFASATHDIAADGFYMLGLDQRGQSFFVGIRTAVYRLAMLLGQGPLVMLAGYLEMSYGDIPQAWAVTFYILSGFMALIAALHIFSLPHPAADVTRSARSIREVGREVIDTFAGFFSKPGILVATLFIFLYKFPEAQLIKLISPFLLDSPEAGGLGLDTSQVGVVYGTVGLTLDPVTLRHLRQRLCVRFSRTAADILSISLSVQKHLQTAG